MPADSSFLITIFAGLCGTLIGAVAAIIGGVAGGWLQGRSWYHYEQKRAVAEKRESWRRKALEWAIRGREDSFRDADLQGADELDGFFFQDATGDGDDTTSDGIFVYAPGAVDVAVGEHIRVRGTVDEYNGLTEIKSPELILSCGSGSVAT